jgi:NADH-quinone oxidoreductase subunit G
MASIYIDNIEFKIETQISILEACKYAGINIPRFCYHEILSVVGNCRMCLVEIENGEKPVASCVTEIENEMLIITNSAFVKKARENVVEALLLNHPLDCPICDQAGECDLQDQTKNFGGVHSRYLYEKKGAEDKYCGPLIKTIMTRCITCTRCVRYSTEIAGVDFFGTLNRGRDTEIGSYIPDFFDSEISANVVDLCPVGALTSKPYAFKARPWELRLAESIDVTDSSGSNIYINYKGNKIFRILPKSNVFINDGIISDKARYVYDSNAFNRISSVFLYDNRSNKYVKFDWIELLETIETKTLEKQTLIVIDEKIDMESLFGLMNISKTYPEKIKIVSIDNKKYRNFFTSYNQLSFSEKISKVNDYIFIIGANTRNEISVFNVKIRNKYRNEFISVISGGYYFKNNIGSSFLNLNIFDILKVFDGKNLLTLNLYNSKNFLVLIGESLQSRFSSFKSLYFNLTPFLRGMETFEIKNKVNSFGLEYAQVKSYFPKNLNGSILYYNLEENLKTRHCVNAHKNQNETFWFNSHGSKTSLKQKYIMPLTTSFESEKTYLSIEGRPQKTSKILKSFGDSITMSYFLTSIVDILKITKTFGFAEQKYSKFLKELQVKEQNYIKHSHQNFSFSKILDRELNGTFPDFITVNSYPMYKKYKNFYKDTVETRNSKILSQVTAEFLSSYTNYK